MRVQNVPIQKHENTRFVLLDYALHLHCVVSVSCSYWLCCVIVLCHAPFSLLVWTDKLPVTRVLLCCTPLGHCVNLKGEVCLLSYSVKILSLIIFCCSFLARALLTII